MKKSIVIAGSRGIGKSIADALRSIDCQVIATSQKELDTSNLENIKKFAKENNETDILVLNTGGPPGKKFSEVTEGDWQKYHIQLFLGFVTILQKIKINDGGYIFAITSGVIKKPEESLIISSAYRLAFTSVFKLLSKNFAERNISCINIAPGPFNTDRTRELSVNVEEIEKSLPMKRLGNPKEIGNFVKAIVENDIKYLSGVTIDFDGALSTHVF
jgi:3-oxoacyl-[acyl-carrier protein] reductase